jgi:hypothetical protein
MTNLKCIIKSVSSDYMYIGIIGVTIAILYFIATYLLNILHTITSPTICIITISIMLLSGDMIAIAAICFCYSNENPHISNYMNLAAFIGIVLFIISCGMSMLYNADDAIIVRSNLMNISIIDTIAMCIILPIVRAYCKCYGVKS